MAAKLATSNGNMTAAGTWQDVSDFADYSSVTSGVTTSWAGAGNMTPGAITIDGILFKLSHFADATVGTFSVRLYNSTDATAVAGTTVTINFSDIPVTLGDSAARAGWMFFKFGASVTLIAGKTYVVQATASSSNKVNAYYSSGTTWARGLVISGAAAAAPTTGDMVIITGAWTGAGSMTPVSVTMDQTSSAVKYGTASTSLVSFDIGNGGTLAFGYAAATNYYLNVQGIMAIRYGGTLNIGTVANPIPSDSTARLNFDVTGSVSTYRMEVWGTLVAQGSPRTVGKNVVACLLTANHTAGGLTFTVDQNTGWKSGDLIAIAGTLRTAGRSEHKILNGDAGATTLTISVASSYNHDGNPTTGVQAEVILKTRNVSIGVTTPATKPSTINFWNNSSLDLDWVDLTGMVGGDNSNYGLQIGGVLAIGIDHCHFDSANYVTSYSWGIRHASQSASGDWPAEVTLTHNTISGLNQGFVNLNGYSLTFHRSSLVMEDCWSVGSQTNGYSAFFKSPAPYRQTTMRRCRVADAQSYDESVYLSGAKAWGTSGTPKQLLIEDCVFHDTAKAIFIDSFGWSNILVRRSFFYRTKNYLSSAPVWIYGNGACVSNIVFEDCGFLGNFNGVVYGLNENISGMIFRRCKIGGESGYSSPNFWLEQGASNPSVQVVLEDCDFGTAAGGAYTDLTGSIFATDSPGTSVGFTIFDILMNNCQGTAVGGDLSANFIACATENVRLRKQRDQRVLGAHSVYYPRMGTVARDATFFRQSAPSEKMTPTLATEFVRLVSAPKRFDVNVGSQRTPQVYVYLDPAYNGLPPRLIMKANPAVGINDDTVLATHTGATGSWVKLSGIMPVAAEDDGQVEVVVDCSGSAGAVWCDDWGI